MKIHTKRQEVWWVLRAQTGDKGAFDELLKLVQEPLYRYLFKMVGERALAQDILQEVFILIYRKLVWLREPTLFRPWAYRIASREALKQLKREKCWKEQTKNEAYFNAQAVQIFEQDLTPELKEQLDRWITTQVSPASRAVLLLHYFHRMKLVEIAAVLGIPVGTVKSRLAYGLSCLRKCLDEERE